MKSKNSVRKLQCTFHKISAGAPTKQLKQTENSQFWQLGKQSQTITVFKITLLIINNYCSLTSLNRLTADLTEEAAVVEYTHAPPATTRLQRLHDQMPTQVRFIAS